MKTIIKQLFISLLLITTISCSKEEEPCSEQTWYQDADGDTFGNPNSVVLSCTQPIGFVSNNSDFNDNDSSSFPNAIEVCDGLDNDGDGQVDGLTTSNCGVGEVCENGSCVAGTTYYFDADGDGYGDDSNTTTAGSSAPISYVLTSGDCDDADPSINPGVTDTCGDGIDNNCDGNIDENCVEICDDGIDNDGDGLTDCDDSDCNGDVACPILYADIDGDGYGDPNNIINGGITDNTDCDDLDPSINPGATEIPDNNIDEDCDAGGSKDYTFYADNDGDGYGDSSNSLVASCPAPCNNEAELTIPSGYVSNNIDCDDNDANVNPFITENTTDGIDNNCNGNTDVIYYYIDSDGDGFGDANDSGTTVDFTGSSQNNTDCDDNNANIFFGASEVQDGIDNNCNGLIDEF